MEKLNQSKLIIYLLIINIICSCISIGISTKQKQTINSTSINDTVGNAAIELYIEEPEKITLDVLVFSDTKTYMDYTFITNRASTQWDMIYNQQLFDIMEDGFLMTEDGYYAAALGSYFGKLGNKFIFVLDTGNQIPVIKLDSKGDQYTDINHFAGKQCNDIIEFIIDSTKMPKWTNGYCYGGNLNAIEKMNGAVVEIIAIEGNEYY